MKRTQLYLSTIDPKAGDVARASGVGIEIAEFCTAVNADALFEAANERVLAQIRDVPRRVLHGAFNELFPCAIEALAGELAAYRYAQAAGMWSNPWFSGRNFWKSVLENLKFAWKT